MAFALLTPVETTCQECGGALGLPRDDEHSCRCSKGRGGMAVNADHPGAPTPPNGHSDFLSDPGATHIFACPKCGLALTRGESCPNHDQTAEAMTPQEAKQLQEREG